MFVRILRDPAAEAAGGGTPPTETEKPPAPEASEKKPPASEKPPAKKPEPAPEPEGEGQADEKPTTIVLTPEQYDRLTKASQERDLLLEAENRRKEEARRAEQERLREEGKYKELLATKEQEIAERDTRLRENEERSKRTELERELAITLGNQPLVKGAPAQLMTLLRGDFEVVADGDKWKVQTRDGKTPAQHVANVLKREEYAHFIPADKRGGAGSQGTEHRPEAPPIDPKAPDAKVAAQLAASFKARHGGVPVALAGRNRLAGENN